MAHDPPKTETSRPNANIRSLVSLAILIHLFVVLVAVSSNLRPSRLQERLVTTLSPYTQPLNLKLSDPFSYKVYHYTHGNSWNDDHFLQLEFTGGDLDGQTVRLPGSQWRGLPNRNRYHAFTRMLGVYAEGENDELLGRFLQSVAAHYLQGHPNSRATVRLIRHRPMPLTAEVASREQPADPDAEVYFNTLYEASVSLDAQGRPALTKLEATGQVAPLREQEADDE